jgi:phage gp46-like protein
VLNFTKSTDITSNIYVLLHVRKGSFFQNPDLGNELHNVTKLTDHGINQAGQYIQEALQPLIQCGRAVSVEVSVERDSREYNRLNYQVKATQPDGLIVSYTDFKRVA